MASAGSEPRIPGPRSLDPRSPEPRARDARKASGNGVLADSRNLTIVSVKLLIAGGFGVGKTTMVGSVSEIAPLRTEESLTALSVGTDDLAGVEDKTSTTVALDFGRITIRPGLVLYLFGTPGQDRFWFMWKELALGALGAVVLADTRRLDSCFPAIDFFERARIPFVVGVNCFDGADRYPEQEVRDALDLDGKIPVRLCDVRVRESSKQVLTTLMRHALDTARGRSPTAAPAPATQSTL